MRRQRQAGMDYVTIKFSFHWLNILFHDKPGKEYLTGYVGDVHQEQVEIRVTSQVRDVQQEPEVHQAHYNPQKEQTNSLAICWKLWLTTWLPGTLKHLKWELFNNTVIASTF